MVLATRRSPPEGRDVAGEDRPPSRGQRALWLLDRMAPEAGAYRIAAAGRVVAGLDRDALARALAAVVERHDALRTVFPRVGGEPVRRVLERVEVPVEEVDASGWSAPELDRRASDAAHRPFDLERGPLLRMTLFRRGPGEDRLVFVVHHLVADLWSLAIVLGELGGFLAGRPPDEETGSYEELIAREETYLADERSDADWSWWRERLAGGPPTLDLPADRPRPSVQSFRGGARRMRVPAGTWSRLRRLGRRCKAPPMIVLLAALDALLHRYTGQDDLVVGTPTAGRRSGRLSGVVGYCVNPVPVRTRLEGDPPFEEVIDRVRESALDAFEHQELPFPVLVERLERALGGERDPSRSPLFQVMVGLQRARLGVDAGMAGFALGVPGATLHLGPLELESVVLAPRGSQFDLTVMTGEVDGALHGTLTYAADLFEATTVERWARQLERLLEAVAAHPERRLSELPLLSSAERAQLLVEWNDTAPVAAEDRPATLTEAFGRAAVATPDAVALETGGRSVSYGALAAGAARLAGRLSELGVGPEAPVAVLLPRREELVIALLGVLEAGGAYVPLDPTYPAERLGFMLADSGAVAVVTEPELASRVGLEDLDPRPWVVDPEGRPLAYGGGRPRTASAPASPAAAAGPGNLAYLIYTSGSTGRPKAVAIEHRSALALVRWSEEVFGARELSGVLASTSVCFDLSVFELFVTLCRGGRVFLVDDALALADLGAAAAVTLVNTVPSAMEELIRLGRLPSSVETVNLAGEPLRRSLADAVYRKDGVSRVLDLYGPSEDTTYSTGAVCERPAAPGGEPPGEPAIGRPVTGTTAYVTRDLRPVPLGAAGELLLGGAGLARGYLGRPALTAERFVPDPLAPAGGEPGGRLYRTGDRVRRDRRGELHYLGRLDHQVKVRGFRVEPGEVEALLARRPEVREAVVVARGSDGEAGLRLVAYAALFDEVEPEAAPEDEAEASRRLRRYLASKLPAPLVPSAVVVLDALPRTPNGKIDRRALPEPDWNAQAGDRSALVAPRTPVEAALAEIFREVLGLERVGVEDGFFALGGHSLLAARLLAEIRERLGHELPLSAVFERPTVAGLAAVLRERGAEVEEPAVPAEAIPRLPGDGPWPLSFAQERLWFLEQLEPGRPTYNMPAAVVLRGRLDGAAMASAVAVLVRRHEALRTVIERTDEGPVQRARRVEEPSGGAALGLPLVDLEGLPSGRRPEAGRALARREARRPFDLERGPLFRARLLRLSAEENLFTVTIHHAVCDGWSLGIFVRELAALYEAALAGRPDPLPRPPIRHGDFAVWQRRRLAGERLEELIAWWRNELEGLPELSELPLDRPRPASPTRAGGVHRRTLPATLSERFEALAREHGATPFMALFAAFQTLVHRHSGASDLALGAPVAGRGRPETADVIGLFVDTVVLRSDLADDPSFLDLLERARGRAAAAFGHQALPFDRVVRELAPRREGAVPSLFQVMLALQNAPLGPLALPGITLEPVEIDTGRAKFDLAASFRPVDGGLEGTWVFASELFDATTIARLARRFETLLRGVVDAPERRLSELPLLSAAERHQVHGEWRTSSESYPVGGAIHEMLAARAEVAPDAVALVHEGSVVSLGELRRRWLESAARLRAEGVGPGSLVALFLDRSFDLVAALVGVLETGAAYVPIDPAYPRERIAFMLADSGARAVMTQPSLVRALPPVEEGGPRVVVLDGTAPPERPVPAREGGAEVAPEQAAYVIYTSGSTGRPKGVVVPHRALVNRIAFHASEMEPGDRYLARTTISFDVAILQLVAPLLAGGGAVLVPPSLEQDPAALARLIDQGRATHMSVPPSLLAQLLAELAFTRLRCLRHVITGGEVVPPALAEEFTAAFDAPLVNRYGPTELTLSITSWTCPPDVREPVLPIGRPIARAEVYLLDRALRPVPIGVPGELHGGGVPVARGYLGRPAATAEAFLPDPFSSQPGARLYRTGDLARWRADGEIDFVGRRDQQVKVRGYRIELGEVEGMLGRCPAVAEGVVAARPEPSTGTRHLVAYLVPAAGAGTPAEAVAAARAFLGDRLPAYMVPSSFSVLDELPLTPSGKVDRRALPEPDWRRAEEATYRPPRTPVEEMIASLFETVLAPRGGRRIGTGDDFFDLGGHSLLATRLISRLREALGVELPIRALFENPTVEALAAVAEAASRDGEPPPPLVPVPRPERGRSDASPSFATSFAQERLWFLAQLDPGSPAYHLPGVLRMNGRLDPQALAAAVAGVARRHEALRTVFRARGDGPVQVVRPAAWEALRRMPVVDLSGIAEEEREPAADAVLRTEAARPFDLERGPLLRVTLLRLGPEEHVLMVNTHHIVSDGWSVGVFVREVSSLYAAEVEGGAADLPALPIQYADHAAWQREWLDGAALDRIAGWWREELAGAPDTLELPTDRPRPPVQTFRGDDVRRRYGEPVAAGVARLARELAATPFMVWLSAVGVLLGRLAGQDDLVVGSPVAGRDRVETEGLMGFFVNTLALRVELAGDPSFRELVGRLRHRALGAYAHHDLPFDRLVEAIAPRRDLATTPIFQVLFVLQNAPRERIELPGLALERVETPAPAAKFDLTVDLAERDGGEISARFEHNRDLFDAATVRRWAAGLEELVTAAVADPERRISELPLLTPAERHALLVEWGRAPGPGAAAEPAGGESLAARFRRTAAARPDAVALVAGPRSLTYGGLSRRVRELARRLSAAGVGPEARVGVCAGRSADLVVALLAVLEAGGAYVPLDPAYPAERVRFMLEDSGARVVLADADTAEALGLDDAPGDRVVLPLAGPPATPGGGDRAPDRRAPTVGAPNLAYVIYTSGSTGRPKGVAISHGAAGALVSWSESVYGPEDLDGVLAVTSVCFDLSVFELFVPLLRGGRAILAADALAVAEDREAGRAVLLNTVPSVLSQVLALDGVPESVRVVNLAGEPLQRSLVTALESARLGVERVYDLYGPSEDTTYSTFARAGGSAGSGAREGGGEEPRIGRPVAGTRAYVLDRVGRPVPAGAPGELYLAGAGLARGYLGRPGRTAGSFLPDPLAEAPGERTYRTGDLARWGADGRLEYLGRLDHQVKLRGYRIELGEVETALLAQPEVRKAAVVAPGAGSAQATLVAYVVASDSEGLAERLRGALRRRLPAYSVPDVVRVLRELPLTPSGKVDRRALAATERDGSPGAPASAPPETEVEIALAEIFAEVLEREGIEGIGIEDDFFDLGGHSLKATQVLLRVHEGFGVRVPVRRFFEEPTLAGLAVAVAEELFAEEDLDEQALAGLVDDDE